jgi:hypothetical protein
MSWRMAQARKSILSLSPSEQIIEFKENEFPFSGPLLFFLIYNAYLAPIACSFLSSLRPYTIASSSIVYRFPVIVHQHQSFFF